MVLGTVVNREELRHLEAVIVRLADPRERLAALDVLANYFTFTDISKAKTFLIDQQRLLRDYPITTYQLNFHHNFALVENQNYQYDNSHKHFQEAIRLSEETGDTARILEVYIDYVGTCINLNRWEEANAYIEKSYRLLKKHPNKRMEARLLCREGYFYLHLNANPKAIELFLESKNLIRDPIQDGGIKDYYFLTLMHAGLGILYQRIEDYERSMHNYRRVVDLCETLDIRSRLAWHYLNLGNAFLNMSDLESARLYFKKAIEIEDDSSIAARASALANLGRYYISQNDVYTALDYFQKAEDFLVKQPDRDHDSNYSNVEFWRAQAYWDLDNEKRASYYINRAIEFAKKAEDNRQLAVIFRSLAEKYAEKKDHEKAYFLLLMHQKHQDLSEKDRDKRAQQEMEIKYEVEKRKQEAEELRLQATQLQLKALRSQMNPHFVFNALNSIQKFITSHESKAAAKYLAVFARLIRRSLEYSDLEVITLEKEIEFLRDYLHINEKLRFENRLKSEIIIDPEIEEDILGVPTMIVQPFVENAIEHGLRTKTDGLIRVQFSMIDEQNLLCVVEDNGIGLDKANMLRKEDPDNGLYRLRGTGITEKRLQIWHKNREPRQLIKLSNRLDEKTGEVCGTRAEIVIPILDLNLTSGGISEAVVLTDPEFFNKKTF